MPSPDVTEPRPASSHREKPPEGRAESMLVMVICLVAAVGIIRLAVVEVNSLFIRVAAILGLGGN
ncbi:MAG TPA: hypothetical protein VLE48_12290 [Terriglobales bacterium]|nr:hypothetical protein [Terriglobales bacterium]